MFSLKLLSATKNIKASSRFSTVAENTVKLIFVDSEVHRFLYFLKKIIFIIVILIFQGNRAIVPGRVGKTLLEAAQNFKIDIAPGCNGGDFEYSVKRTDKWEEVIFGEDVQCHLCHVKIPTTFNHLLPEIPKKHSEGIAKVWEDEISSTSRLACQIVLEKKHEGMVVYVPDAPPSGN